MQDFGDGQGGDVLVVSIELMVQVGYILIQYDGDQYVQCGIGQGWIIGCSSDVGGIGIDFCKGDMFEIEQVGIVCLQV